MMFAALLLREDQVGARTVEAVGATLDGCRFADSL
jgi:hypothetical protein